MSRFISEYGLKIIKRNNHCEGRRLPWFDNIQRMNEDQISK